MTTNKDALYALDEMKNRTMMHLHELKVPKLAPVYRHLNFEYEIIRDAIQTPRDLFEWKPMTEFKDYLINQIAKRENVNPLISDCGKFFLDINPIRALCPKPQHDENKIGGA